MTLQQLLLDIGVPSSLFILMLISGTEIQRADFSFVKAYRKPILIGITTQLLLVPILALVLLRICNLDSSLALGMLLLTLCPGGGISNYYTYLAKCDVLLSAAITSIGTVFSLLTIPLWLLFLKSFFLLDGIVPNLPAVKILSALLFLVIAPIWIGSLLNYKKPLMVSRMKKSTQIFSLFLIFLILFFNSLYFYDQMVRNLFSIFLQASCFVLGSMLLAWLLTSRISSQARPVVIIESAVRNISIALIVGKILFPIETVGVLTGFLIGYFVVEVGVMLAYARFTSLHNSQV